MKKIIYFIALTLLIFLSSCEKNEVLPPETYSCQFDFQDSSSLHIKAAKYQQILDEGRKNGIIGASLLVKDKDGVWVGASGKADIASKVDVMPCNRFLIASISKTFTATAIFAYVDKGILSIEDPVSKWIDEDIISKLENADKASIKHLLNHTSGLADYFSTQYELDRINTIHNNWKQEDILKYAYNKPATNAVGETYYYANSNYLLLGMILEKASGLKLEQVYEQEIFTPLNLTSAYYDTDNPLPKDVVKGYVDFYGDGKYVESEFLYKDELNTADGGIAINAYDLGVFFEGLMKGNLISTESLEQMTNWANLPSDWVDEDFGHFQNGLGLEYNRTPYGNSVGHTGGIDGFLSIAQYFPEEDVTFILLVNSGSYENAERLFIYNETLKAIFE
ncbi:serine hydrolase domain-containing protein [Bernardetia sp. OM2101]|uniref:serine hydrolase domain-containing protein n=1 Tax=Bernardetia sp. OM2101 TaxID=3344876 RepID=UPI0035CFFE80